jgi:hypothetical protein
MICREYHALADFYQNTRFTGNQMGFRASLDVLDNRKLRDIPGKLSPFLLPVAIYCTQMQFPAPSRKGKRKTFDRFTHH